MALLKGITIIRYDNIQSGTDQFKAPIYTQTPIEVKNVLVSPVSTADIVSDLQLYGKRAEYELCIPKGNTDTWEDTVVEFYGHKWKTFGIPQQWIGDLVPLDWNRKVRVERYG